MQVLVTGAYGFLGTYIVRELLEQGTWVRAFGRDPEKLRKLKEEMESCSFKEAEPAGFNTAGAEPDSTESDNPRLELFQGDFCVPEEIEAACRGMDYVVHCGALLKGWGKREDFFRTNVEGTKNVLRACEKAGIRRLIYVSSPSCDPLKDNLCIREEDYNEKNRINFYVESKIAAEKLVRSQTAVPFAAVRPRGISGIGDRNMLPVLIKANNTIGIPLFQGGNVVVDMCCVENVALSVRLCLEKDEALGQVYNITNGEPRKLTDLVNALFPKLSVTPKFRKLPFGVLYALAAVLEGVYRLFGIYDKTPAVTRYNLCTLGKSQVFDIGKAKRELGYSPKITLDEMMDKYAEAYREGRA